MNNKETLPMVAVSLDHRVQPAVDRAAPAANAENLYTGLLLNATDAFLALFSAAQSERPKEDPLTLLKEIDQLNAHKPRHVPGLSIAFKQGLAPIVKLFVDTALNSQSATPPQKTDFLAARLSSGTPGLLVGLEYGHAEAVKVFVDAVLNSDALDENQKVDLLAAKRPDDGTPGLQMALQNGHAETVRAFAESVLASNKLPVQKKLDY